MPCRDVRRTDDPAFRRPAHLSGRPTRWPRRDGSGASGADLSGAPLRAVAWYSRPAPARARADDRPAGGRRRHDRGRRGKQDRDQTKVIGGVEAILQEDATAGVLATALAADRLVFLTGVDQVEVGHRTERAIGIERLSLAEARALLTAREFPSGSIGPKIEAAVAFVEAGGREGIITSLAAVGAALDGRGGTRVVP
jgi:hypothetical protein